MKFVIMFTLLFSRAVFAQENIQDLVTDPVRGTAEAISEQLIEQDSEELVSEDEINLDNVELDQPATAFTNSQGAVEPPEIERELEEGVEGEYIEEQALTTAEETVVASEPLPANTAQRGSEVVNLSATIVGNQEQPTVLYIVPWKPAEDTTILYLPLSSKAMEHIFGHVERVEHQRQVQYIDQLDKQ